MKASKLLIALRFRGKNLRLAYDNGKLNVEFDIEINLFAKLYNWQIGLNNSATLRVL